MIKFRNDAVTNGVLKGVGFSGENEKGMRSLSLNCNIASREILKRFCAKILWEASGPRHDPMLADEMGIGKSFLCRSGMRKRNGYFLKI